MNFIISGFHLVLVYGPGTQPEDIDKTKLILSTPPPPFPPLIDDPHRRLYRGLDPRTQPAQDRVEVVGFNTKGKYLVICGVLPHFFDPPPTRSSCSVLSTCEATTDGLLR